jgi:hypothetical protein
MPYSRIYYTQFWTGNFKSWRQSSSGRVACLASLKSWVQSLALTKKFNFHTSIMQLSWPENLCQSCVFHQLHVSLCDCFFTLNFVKICLPQTKGYPKHNVKVNVLVLVAHTCDPSYLGGWDQSGGLWFEANLAAWQVVWKTAPPKPEQNALEVWLKHLPCKCKSPEFKS